ncbi:MAG: NAD-glutamate dehydrogenase, partial [Micrococcales bacterium]|nr:NAD-glutamate dehydrogenase [Micrococcales bacterium]
MSTSLEESRQQLLDEAAALADRSVERPKELLHGYYRHVAGEDLLACRAEDLVGAALSHRSLARQRTSGQANVRVFTPSVEQEGWATGHTVVEIVTDDMPFLVDSVSAELSRQGRAVHLVVHPQLLVRRDESGRLLDVLGIDIDLSAADLPPGAIVESWMHLQIDRESHPQDREDLNDRIQSILVQVRAAVQDWPGMRERARALGAEIEEHPPPGLDTEQTREATSLLDWMASDQFTFLGYREYVLERRPDGEYLCTVPGSGLGLLREDSSDDIAEEPAATRLPPAVAAKAREKHLCIITKANSRSPVHRSVYLDYIGIKAFDEAGDVTGERRFLGLFTSSAYTSSVSQVPFLSAKVDAVIKTSRFAHDSHLAKDLLGVLETYPRDELFQAGADHLTETAKAVVHLAERRRTRLFLRKDAYGRFMSCLVYLPRDRYNTAVRLRMEGLLSEAFHGASVEYTTRVSESSLARLHFVVRVRAGQTLPDVDVPDLERRLVAATRTWDEDLSEATRAEYGEEHGARLLGTYARAFPEAYKEDFHARVAVSDLHLVEQLDAEGDFRLNLYHSPGAPEGERRLKFYRRGSVSLSKVLPYFTDMGVVVTDERPYELRRHDGIPVHIYDFGLRASDEESWTRGTDGMRTAFQEAFESVWEGLAESDGFNALVLSAGLTWRQIVILRTVAKYLRQTGTTFSQAYFESTLRGNGHIAQLLVELFEARFDPDRFVDADEDHARAADEETRAMVLSAVPDPAE